jgi:hypothetical protein
MLLARLTGFGRLLTLSRRQSAGGKKPRPLAWFEAVAGSDRQLTTAIIPQTDPLPTLDFWNKKGTMFLICSNVGSRAMLRMFVEEAAALASITLFVGMIAVWAQLIPQL